ncbi:hypothetical protein IFT60_05060 [Massilia sp. CFBP 13721]|nr:hypothetical protein [Massilia sp. CFBP 13721]
MEPQLSQSIEYRAHDIVFNPSGKADDACADAFMILQPSPNPMFSSVLYEHPRDKIRTYDTAEDARRAAIAQAQAWIDARLDGHAMRSSEP